MINLITISRERGSGGRFVGTRLAKEFGMKLFGKEIIYDIARAAGVAAEVEAVENDSGLAVDSIEFDGHAPAGLEGEHRRVELEVEPHQRRGDGGIRGEQPGEEAEAEPPGRELLGRHDAAQHGWRALELRGEVFDRHAATQRLDQLVQAAAALQAIDTLFGGLAALVPFEWQ